MNAIDIRINQAQILSYTVELNGTDKPDISASIGLFAGNKRISTFSLRTKTYFSDGISFDLPVDMFAPILEIAKQLEVVLIQECNKQLLRLPAKSVESEEISK